jgi:P-type Ca2+ transporter type 2C
MAAHDRASGPNLMTVPALTEPRSGLTSADADRLLREVGPNRLVPTPSRSRRATVLWRAVSDPMAVLLLIAAPTYLALGNRLDALVTFLALGPITAIGVALETRAEHALEQLAALVAPTTIAVRDGVEQIVDAEHVVPGDMLVVREGDVIAADGELVGGGPIVVDEARLTGESVPVTKSVGEDTALYAGTTVLTGRAYAEIAVTGLRTQYGRIGSLVARVRPSRTPLERKVRRFVARLTVVAGGFCAAVVTTELVRGQGWGDAIVAGVSLGIAAIPEEYLIVLTLSLALGATRLARQRALVRRLPAVEALGSTTVICTDKTGTLTRGRLEVVALATPNVVVDAATPLSEAARSLLQAAILASEPDPYDPLDRALYEVAARHGMGRSPGTLERDHPFDLRDKYVTHVWRDDDTWNVAAKGALEGVLLHARMGADEVARLVALHAQLAEAGMRVICVASGTTQEQVTSRADDERDLRVDGLIGFSDPLREGVADALVACHEAGVRVLMITGDHPVTARAVADSLHMDGSGAVVTGDDLDACTDDDALNALVASSDVFARVRPEQKHRIVHALRARGEVVAMTGDGINDAPALREADIGVAFGGERGTEVARQAATLVLLDDNFATIVSAVRGGRRIFGNLRHAFSYLAVFHAPLLLAALVVPLVGKPLLLLPMHMILLELLLHPIVALVFERDPADPDVMRRPPRSAGAAILSRAEIWRAVAVGTTVAAAILGLYFWELSRNDAAEHARALGFATLLFSALILMLASRSSSRPVWRVAIANNAILLPAIVTMLAVIAVVFGVPAVRSVFEMSALRPVDWLIAAGAAAGATLWVEPFKRPSTRVRTLMTRRPSDSRSP